MALSLASAVITVYSVYKMITIIKELGGDYNTPKFIVHAFFVVIETLAVCLNAFSTINPKAFEAVVLTDLVCQLIVAYIFLTVGSQKALKDFECTIA
jgi:hypothetical protein